MLRASVGVWLNYATTIAFQVLFAARFGASPPATAFVILFGFAIGLSSIAAGGIKSVLVPRLVSPTGDLYKGAIRTLILATSFGGAAVAICIAFPGLVSFAIGRQPLAPGYFAACVRLACLFGLLQLLAAALAVVVLAQGKRFQPAFAPAWPSIGGAVYLVLVADPTIKGLLGILCLGSGVQVAVIAAGGRWSVRLISEERALHGRLVALTVGVTTGLSFLAPVERAVAAHRSSSGGADYFYATRSLSVAQQLLIGGLLLAILADWSRATGGAEAMHRSVAPIVTTAALLLGLAVAVAVVSGRSLVAAVYQHGAFDAGDTGHVTRVLLIALPGFFFEGLGLVLSQALLAARRNRTTITIGAANVTLRLALVFSFGIAWGADGVAAAYSAATILVFFVQARAAHRIVDVLSGTMRAFVVVTATLALAATLAYGVHVSAPSLAAAVVAAAFALLVLAIRPLTIERRVQHG